MSAPRVHYRCAECGARVDVPSADGANPPSAVTCASCGAVRELAPADLADTGGLLGCRACGHPELYRRKAFPRALGIGIVVAAAVLAPFTNYLSLAAAALLDLVFFLTMPEEVVCYVCDAVHRGFPTTPKHPRFDREIDERLKYGKRAVMGRPMREGGTAGAPEPEH